MVLLPTQHRFQALIGDCLAGCCPFAKMVPAVRPEDMNADPEVCELQQQAAWGCLVCCGCLKLIVNGLLRLQLIRQYMEDPDIYQGQVKARSANEILKVRYLLQA